MYGHDCGTVLDLVQQVQDPEGAMWHKYIQDYACCRDLEKEKGLAEEERPWDCLLLGLGRGPDHALTKYVQL